MTSAERAELGRRAAARGCIVPPITVQALLVEDGVPSEEARRLADDYLRRAAAGDMTLPSALRPVFG